MSDGPTASPMERAPLGVASTIHALDATAVALRPASAGASGDASASIEPGPSAPLVRGTCSATRYERLGLLGEGGMGSVDAVWDADLMRHLAVKRLKPALREDARMVSLFLWEARVTAHLDHPNIVPIYDLAIGEQGTLFFTMKRAEGRTLERAIEEAQRGEGPIDSLGRRLRLFVSLCHAVTFAHTRGVLHRDLKPANVMVGEHGEVLVMDWGLASPLPDERGALLRSLRVDADLHGSSGTPLYMSPEQAKNTALDERSDVYTLGVILYELVGLGRPYTATTLPALLAQIVAGEGRPLRTIAPDASASIVAVVERAMALDPAARYPSVEALREDVERVLDGHTPSAEDANLLQRAARLYVSRDRGLSRLRVIDIEMMIGASIAMGVAGTGFVLSGGLWPWLVSALALALWVPPTVRWRRERDAKE